MLCVYHVMISVADYLFINFLYYMNVIIFRVTENSQQTDLETEGPEGTPHVTQKQNYSTWTSKQEPYWSDFLWLLLVLSFISMVRNGQFYDLYILAEYTSFRRRMLL